MINIKRFEPSQFLNTVASFVGVKNWSKTLVWLTRLFLERDLKHLKLPLIVNLFFLSFFCATDHRENNENQSKLQRVVTRVLELGREGGGRGVGVGGGRVLFTLLGRSNQRAPCDIPNRRLLDIDYHFLMRCYYHISFVFKWRGIFILNFF